MPRGLGRKGRSLLFVELWDSKLEGGRRVLCERGRPLGVGHLEVDQRLHLGGDRQARRGVPMGWRLLQRAGRRWLEVEWLQVRRSVYYLLRQDLVLDTLSFFAQKVVKISSNPGTYGNSQTGTKTSLVAISKDISNTAWAITTTQAGPGTMQPVGFHTSSSAVRSCVQVFHETSHNTETHSPK